MPTKLLLTILLFSFSILGCALVAKPDKEISEISYEANQTCNKMPAKIAFKDGIFSTNDIEKHDLTDPKNADRRKEVREQLILEEVQKSNLISEYSERVENKDYIVIGFSYDNEINWGYSYLTILSLGLIPLKLDGNFKYTATVFDKKGQLIQTYSATTKEYTQYMGWLMMPFVPWSQWSKDSNIYEKYTPKMIGEIILQMEKDGVVGCRKPKI